MKRDLDLIRALLLHIEEHVAFDPDDDRFMFEHEDQNAVAYALHLMKDRGLITANMTEEYNTPLSHSYFAVTITWDGQEFLNTVRDDEIWRKTKEGAKSAGGFTFDLLKALAKGFVKKKIQDNTGIELEL